jgi:3-oxoacyl-[acyl-carrier protein] reductase
MNKTVALVTGAARGIGFATARRLAVAGHRVVAIDVLDDVLQAAVAELRQAGHDAVGLTVDLADPAAIAGVPARLGDDFGRIAVLVNNAGISPKQDGKKVPLELIPLAQWDLTLNINLRAPLLLSQLVLPGMRERGFGRIVNVSSRAARAPSGIAGADYVASKSGLVGLTKAIAQDFAAFGITANSVAPGSVDGPMQLQNDAATRAAALAKIPVGRLSSPDEIADAIAFLASPEAGYITGVTLDINGGVVMS